MFTPSPGTSSGGFISGGSGDKFERELKLPEAVTGLAVDDAGSIAFVSAGRGLYMLDLRVPQSEPAAVYLAADPIRHLTAHPRKADVVYFAEGAQLFELNHAKGSSAPVAANGVASAPAESLSLGAESAELPPAGGLSTAEAALDTLLAGQPPVDEVVAAAMVRAGYKASEVNRWRILVRRRNLIPQLKTVFGSSEDELRNYTDGDRQADRVQDFDHWRVELTWDLRKFLFDPDEIDIADHASKNSDSRNRLVEEVTKLYYDRIEILLAQHLEGSKVKTEKRVEGLLKLKRINAQLNAMCGRTVFE